MPEAVSAEDLEGQFTQPEDAGAIGGGDPAAGGGAEGEGVVAPPSGPAKLKVGETEYDQAEIESLIEFQQWAQANQDKMQAFGQYLNGEADFTPKSTETKPEGTPEDPYAAIEDETLRERLRTQEAALESLRQTQASQVTASSLQEAERAINGAYDTIRERYGLDENEIKELATATAQSGILPGIRSTEPDPQVAATKALDATYWMDQKYRNKAVENEILRLDSHQQRQALAGAVGGSSGSVSREVPSDQEVAKMSQSEKLTAMAAEVASSMRGTT